MIYNEEKYKQRKLSENSNTLDENITRLTIDFEKNTTVGKSLLRNKKYNYESDWINLDLTETRFAREFADWIEGGNQDFYSSEGTLKYMYPQILSHKDNAYRRYEKQITIDLVHLNTQLLSYLNYNVQFKTDLTYENNIIFNTPIVYDFGFGTTTGGDSQVFPTETVTGPFFFSTPAVERYWKSCCDIILVGTLLKFRIVLYHQGNSISVGYLKAKPSADYTPIQFNLYAPPQINIQTKINISIISPK